MRVAIQPDHHPCGPSAPRWAAALGAAGCEVREVDVYRPDILEQLRGCDGFMWRFGQRGGMMQIAQRLVPVIERELGLLVYPDRNTAWHYDDKIAQAHLFKALDIPTAQTWVWFDRDAALAWAATAPLPLVMKLTAGAGAENVQLIETHARAAYWIRRMFDEGVWELSKYHIKRPGPKARLVDAARILVKGKPPPPPPSRWDFHKGYILFQEFIPDNNHDTRITVIGNRAFCFRRFNRPGDFRASGSGRIDYDQAAINPAAIRLAYLAAERLGTQSLAADIVYRPTGAPVILEVAYTYMSGAVHDCPGHWELDGPLATGRLRWVDGHMWPEEAQVTDFLARLKSRPPCHTSVSGASPTPSPPCHCSAACHCSASNA